ncbi:LysR family transcriptional regulator [Streptomyces sp. NBC_00996]|uniref:LysR family transcriptional regulator n=1 Tax=Streptomyces sp. NBC_00996 TaxID=2903710 RepID=UPI00386AF8E6|nr:LysR family transcriptional regulator [Streptomyces sp. NBC_00996]
MDRMELEAFVAVADELHFGCAAARLHRGQPTVSDAVRRLETTLGGRLFDRTSRRVSLTVLGEELLPDAHATLAQLRRFEQRGRSLAAGGRGRTTLVVGHAEYTDYQLLLRCLPRLRERFPDVMIVPEAMPTTAQVTALRAGTINLGIGWATGDVTGARATPLSTERFMALVPASHPLAGHDHLSASELSTTGLLTWPHQINSGLCDRLLSAFRIGGADLRIIRTADSVQAIAAHVAAGTGIGITVESAMDHEPPGLRIIPLTGPSTTADQVVLTPAEPSDAATALRNLLLHSSAEPPRALISQAPAAT